MNSICPFITYTLNKLLKCTLIHKEPWFMKTVLLKQREITLHIKIQSKDFLQTLTRNYFRNYKSITFFQHSLVWLILRRSYFVARIHHSKSWVSTYIVHLEVKMSGMLPWTMMTKTQINYESAKKILLQYYR